MKFKPCTLKIHLTFNKTFVIRTELKQTPSGTMSLKNGERNPNVVQWWQGLFLSIALFYNSERKISLSPMYVLTVIVLKNAGQ